MKKIVKFGGSSLANAEQFQKVGEIIRSDESRRYVVPSAPGKRFDGDTKVTDLLYKCYNTAVEGEDFIPILQEIKGRYYEIIRGLNLDLSLEDEFAQIEADFKAQAGTDYAASRGEFLNGKVMAAYLGYEFVDAADVIRFDKNGNLDAEKTDRLLSKKLAKCEHAVIPGFYGAGEDGKVKTFSRGGSDVTGSLLAQAIKEIFGVDNPIKIIGARHGEKMYETLCTSEEMGKAEDLGNFYRIPADLRDLNYSQYVDEFGHRVDCKQYNSDNTRRLDVEQMKEMLLKLDYVREELAKFKAKA